MADFSQFVGGGPTGSPVTAKQGVADNSQVVQLQSLNSLASLGSKLFSSSQKAEAAQSLETAKADITSRLLTVTDAHAMGEVDQRTAQAMSRKLYSQALAEGKVETEELRSIFSPFLDVGASLKKGTAEEQEAAKIRESAVSSGWVKPSMNDKEQQAALNNYQDFTLAGEKLKRSNLVRDSNTANRVNSQRVALSEMNAAYTDKFRGDIKDIQSRLTNGEINPEAALAELDNNWANIQSLINSQGSEAGGEFLSNMTAPMKTIYESAKKFASGEISKDVYQNISDRNIAAAKANITGDPETAKVVAFSSMFQNSDILLRKEIGQEVLKFIGKNGDTTKRPADLTDPADQANTSDYLSMFKDTVKTVNQGTAQDMEASTLEAQNNLTQIVRGVGQYGAMVDNPSELNTVFDTLADPSTGKFLVGSGGVPADVAAEAKIVFDEAYRDPAVQAVIEDFSGGRIRSGNPNSYWGVGTSSEVGVSQAILPVFSGAGVTFIMDASVSKADRNAVRARIKDLNKKAAPVLNRLIRLDAHLSGTTDYAKVYNDNYEMLFAPQDSQAANEQGDSAEEQVPSTAPNLPSTDNSEQVAQL